MLNKIIVTIGKNIIGAPKMRNNYGTIQLLIFFSIAPCQVIAPKIFLLNFSCQLIY